MASRDFYSDGMGHNECSDDMRDECGRAALALTALFDGAANETETLLAKAHLESCVRCEWLWQSWTQTRFILRRLPVSEVPPGLLTRVLLAVRLLSFTQPNRSHLSPAPHFQPQSMERRDARLVTDNLLASGVSPFAPRRSKKALPQNENQNSTPTAMDLPPLDLTVPQPPPDFTARILNQTVGLASRREMASLGNRVAVCEAENLKPSRARGLSRINNKSFGAALLPVATAWLFLLARAPQLAETLPSALPGQTSLSQTPALRKPVAKSMTPLAHSEEKGSTRIDSDKRALPVETADSPIRFATANLDTRTPESARRLVTALPRSGATPATVLQTKLVDEVTREDAKVAAVAVPTGPVLTNQPTTAITLSLKPKMAVLPRRAPAISVASERSRARHAIWSAPEVAETRERSTQWGKAARHAMSPDAAGEAIEAHDEDAAPDAAEILDHVARLTDSRPEDVRDVVDDFRASLAASSDETETSVGAAENG